jgi:hypothetical protein
VCPRAESHIFKRYHARYYTGNLFETLRGFFLRQNADFSTELDWHDDQVTEISITRESTIENVAAQMQGVADVIQHAQSELQEFHRLCGIRDGMAQHGGPGVEWTAYPLRQMLADTQEDKLFRVKFVY